MGWRHLNMATKNFFGKSAESRNEDIDFEDAHIGTATPFGPAISHGHAASSE